MLQLAPLLGQLTIKTKDLRLKRLDIANEADEFAWAQRRLCHEIERQYNAGLPVRILVLKARQLGISTATEGVMFHWTFLHPGTSGLVVTHEADLTEKLFQTTQLYWDTWRFKDLYNLRYQTRRQLYWEETHSELRVATAKNVGSGRSATLQAVHLSECAFYPDPAGFMTGLNQAVPEAHGTIMVLESTANGTGNWWHRMWNAAEEGESEFLPLFFPWYHHYEYRRRTTLSTLIELTAEERQMIRLGADYENVEWYRWALYNKVEPGDEQSLHQEYPTTPEDAFISTGHHIFPREKVKECFVEEKGYRGYLVENNVGAVVFVHDVSGNLIVYRGPKRGDTRWDRYFVSGDPSETVTGDPTAIQVINRQTNEQVAVWHGQRDPLSFADEMMLIGRFYNEAMLCPEVEGGGQAAVARIITKGYPHVWQHRWADKAPGKVAMTYGWATNFQRKSWCVGRLKAMIATNGIIIHDRKTKNQLNDYVVREDGSWGDSGDTGDDAAVISLAIGVTASETEGPFVPDLIPRQLPVRLTREGAMIDVDIFRDDSDEPEATEMFSGYGY